MSFQTRIIDALGEVLYTTDTFKSEAEAVGNARDWLFWFENAPLKKAISIYYILAVPDSWMGGILDDNPYNGLQVKIGMTKDLRTRISNLRTGADGQLVLHAMEPGSRRREDEIHQIFASDRRQGEWFMCSMLLYQHIMDTWRRNRLLPPEYQGAVLQLRERIRIYRSLRKSGAAFDMVNPSINDNWQGSVFVDLAYSNILKQK